MIAEFQQHLANGRVGQVEMHRVRWGMLSLVYVQPDALWPRLEQDLATPLTTRTIFA